MMDQRPIDDPIAGLIRALHGAGWSIGDALVARPDGSRAWLVTAHDGEHLIQAEGTTLSGAWRAAIDQARSLGMLGRG